MATNKYTIGQWYKWEWEYNRLIEGYSYFLSPETSLDSEIIDQMLVVQDIEQAEDIINNPSYREERIYYPPNWFVKLVKNYCANNNILFIPPEIRINTAGQLLFNF